MHAIFARTGLVPVWPCARRVRGVASTGNVWISCIHLKPQAMQPWKSDSLAKLHLPTLDLFALAVRSVLVFSHHDALMLCRRREGTRSAYGVGLHQGYLNMLSWFLVYLLLRDGCPVYAQGSAEGAQRSVGSAEQLGQAIREGTPAIHLVSNITGIVGEQAASGGSVFDLSRYVGFPEVPSLP